MGNCENCRFWMFGEPDWQFDSVRLGECKAVKMREHIIEPAGNIRDWRTREAEEARLLREAKAVAVDGSGYYAALRTAPDFGCVLFARPTHEGGEDGRDG